MRGVWTQTFVALGAAVVDVNIKEYSAVTTTMIFYLNCGPLRLRSSELRVLDNETDDVRLGRPVL
jgi:hypothetical protein